MDQSVQDLSPLFLSVFTGTKITDSEPLMVEMQDGPDSRADLLLVQGLKGCVA